MTASEELAALRRDVAAMQTILEAYEQQIDAHRRQDALRKQELAFLTALVEINKAGVAALPGSEPLDIKRILSGLPASLAANGG